MKLKHACVDAGQYGVNVSPEEYRSNGVRMIRTSDLSNGGLAASDDGVYLDGPVPAAQVLQPDDLLLSRAGTIGRSYLVPEVAAGMTFAGFLVRFRPRTSADPRYLSYAIQSSRVQHQIEAQAVTSTISNFNADRYANLELPDLGVGEQRRIADFLDDRVSRIDRIIAARREQIELVAESSSRLSYDVVRGATVPGARRDSHLDWLGDIPATWGVLSVGSQYTVELGKMLDDKRQTGVHRLPYLRNTNVQWDEISVDDLKEMDIPESEYTRYTVRPGDLLICEGGQPGRSAIWDGRIAPLGFQKALHRARSRGRSASGWLLECLRVAVDLDVFAEASGQTTIAHLTNEQLRSQRFPFPDGDVQTGLLDELDKRRGPMTSIINGLDESIGLLTEYKSSLITAAVTGELDVSTAGSNIPG